MKNYTTYLFDFDYTLADASKGIVMCFRHVLSANDCPDITDEQIKRTIGMTLEEAFALLMNKPESECGQYRAPFRELSNEVMTKYTFLLPQAAETLRALKAAGKKVGIISTKNRSRIMESVEKFQLYDCIDLVVGMEDVQKAKPDPEGIYRALTYFQAEKEQTLYVGDSLIDARAAQAAGVDFAAVTTGTTTEAEFAALVGDGVRIEAVMQCLSEVLRVGA